MWRPVLHSVYYTHVTYKQLLAQNTQLKAECHQLEREAFHWAADARRGRLQAGLIGAVVGAAASALAFAGGFLLHG